MNDFPDSLISSAEMSVDSVSNFASIVRVKVNFPPLAPPPPPGDVLSIWRITVNHSDSDANLSLQYYVVWRHDVGF